jgi:hypothetical protein
MHQERQSRIGRFINGTSKSIAATAKTIAPLPPPLAAPKTSGSAPTATLKNFFLFSTAGPEAD